MTIAESFGICVSILGIVGIKVGKQDRIDERFSTGWTRGADGGYVKLVDTPVSMHLALY